MNIRTALLAGILALLCGCLMTRSGPIARAHNAIEEGDDNEALTRLSLAERYTELTDKQKSRGSVLESEKL